MLLQSGVTPPSGSGSPAAHSLEPQSWRKKPLGVGPERKNWYLSQGSSGSASLTTVMEPWLVSRPQSTFCSLLGEAWVFRLIATYQSSGVPEQASDSKLNS